MVSNRRLCKNLLTVERSRPFQPPASNFFLQVFEEAKLFLKMQEHKYVLVAVLDQKQTSYRV